MMQLLQTMMADREVERAERQANITALQQIAQNNQGHGNHDHPGSKLKNFQHTNPPMFNKTEEPLDADDWLQTMENNLEIAGVEAAEKVLFATHYLAGQARAWWTSTRAMNAGQMMTWEDFKLKFSKYHVPQELIKKMRDEFRELKQGRMSVVEYRDRFLTLSRYAPDETDTNEKRKEIFLNGLHDEMQTVLVNIPFADLEALVDSAIQMEGKLHQANENRKRRMMNQNGPHHNQKYRNNSSGGFTPRYNKPPAQNYRPNYTNNNGGPPKPGGNNNNNNSSHNNNNHPNNSNNNGNNNNPNTAPRTGSNATPVIPKDKSTVNCYECGVVGHFSNECPKKLARIAANTAAPAQQQRRFAGRRNQNNNNGRFYHMTATEAQEAPQTMPKSNMKPMLQIWLDQVHLCPSLLLWSLPAPLLYLTLHLPALALDHLDQNQTMPALLSHTMLTPSPLPSKSPQHVTYLALTLLITTIHLLTREDVGIGQDQRAQTRPGRPMRDRTRMVMPQSAPGHHLAPSTQRSPRPLLSPATSPRHQLARRHRQLDALALPPSSRTTTIRHCCPSARTMTIATDRHFLRRQVPHTHNDVAYPPASAPNPLDHCIAVVTLDMPHPSASTASYKRRHPRT
ncbi:hypothetical protein QYE76_057906 [Lolium multiflorum]|uniref:CCHC-type domain-containing protein n=1 Tax=Lolium multiflorum TaxID=4521 RepID=A0AAD8T474_LOLMU|nr:hypothetical protein QYE76_057906 [Lolium multiflorum]